MTDKLKTFEVRTRFRIKARSKKDARIALRVSNIILAARLGTRPGSHGIYIKIDNIEVLGEVVE